MNSQDTVVRHDVTSRDVALVAESLALEDELRRAARTSASSVDPYVDVVTSINTHLARIATERCPDVAPDTSFELEQIEVIEYDELGLTGRTFQLRASGHVGRTRFRTVFGGTCDARSAQLKPQTIRVWPKGDWDQTSLAAPVGDDAKALRNWAWWVAGGLVVMTALGTIAAWLTVSHLFDTPKTNVLEMLTLAASFGWLGSCLAALRSFIDRSAQGVEYDRLVGDAAGVEIRARAQWPNRPKGTQRFNTYVGRGMLLRPLLGALTAPLAYFALFVVSSTVQFEPLTTTPDSDTGIVLIGISGLAGMFAKTVLDNLNESTKNLFKPHRNAP